jgi:hypothetical protein
MRYELTSHEWAAIKPMLPNKPRGVPRVKPCPQRHLLGFAVRSALARPAGRFWSLHHLLQSFRSLAAGGRLGQDYEHAGSRP